MFLSWVVLQNEAELFGFSKQLQGDGVQTGLIIAIYFPFKSSIIVHSTWGNFNLFYVPEGIMKNEFVSRCKCSVQHHYWKLLHNGKS